MNMKHNGTESAGAIKAIGINKSHCSSLCLVDGGGQPVFCASEERFTRKKLQPGMPHQAFAYADEHYDLDNALLAMGRLGSKDRVLRELEYYRECGAKNLFAIPKGYRAKELANFWFRKKVLKDRELHRFSVETKYFADKNPDFGFEHHLCHMATAYYCSGFDDAAVVSVDGVGDLLSAVVGTGRGKDLAITHRYFHSEHIAGQAYEIVTAMLGFHPDRHPGKVTGLAAYAEPSEELIAALDSWLRDQYRKGAGDNWFFLIHTSEAEANIERLRRVREERFGKWSREQIASAIQHLLERDVIELIRRHVQPIEGGRIVLAGGVFANVKLNQRIKEMGFGEIFVQPAMGDEGTGLGAAMLAAHGAEPFEPYRLNDVYLGPEFSPSEIRAALDAGGLEYTEMRNGDLEQRLAELLHKGYVVARFQGRMEFGPRALGNRSILYPAVDASVNDWLNRQLNRSEFMPFAPVTLYEHADECYLNISGAEHTAQFMTITFSVTETMQKQSPACVHVDGTARPQLVRREVNPSLHETIRRYHELSGIPSIINTSFNMHEEPIICTPEEAVRAYTLSNLDALAIGDFLVVNREGRAAQGAESNADAQN